jgi:hypothetical protein
MTLGDIKKRTLALIEALDTTLPLLTDDIDFQKKINYCIDQVQTELAQVKPITAKTSYTVTDSTLEQSLPSGFYQVDKLETRFYIYDNKIVFEEAGTYDMYYSKFPTTITADTVDTTIMELTLDCLNAMPYGVASDMLKADVSTDYSVYAKRYNDLLNQIRIGTTKSSVYVDDSVEYS